jgi:hypothetical protein
VLAVRQARIKYNVISNTEFYWRMLKVVSATCVSWIISQCIESNSVITS